MCPVTSAVRNVIIIGSGPAGWTAAVYAARANLEPLVFEGAVTAGGALMNTTEVENFPGFRDGIMGPDLMENMRAQAERFGAEIITDDVQSVRLEDDVKVVTDSEGVEHRALAVILAMGSAYRELGLPDEKRLSGHGVSWCATCDGFFFRDQDIAVVGGGDSAVEEATFLTKFARTVTIVHRRDELRASTIMAERAHANPKIRFAWNSAVDAIHGEGKLTGVTLRDTVTGETRELPVTGLFVAIGHDPRNELVKGVVELDAEGYVLVEGRSTRTNVPGRLRLRRPRRPHLPPGHHGRRLRLRRSPRRRALPLALTAPGAVGRLRQDRPQTPTLTPLLKGPPMGAVSKTTDATFEADVLKSDKPVLVDFWAEWCGPCRAVAPILDEIARDHDEVSIVKLNTDENPAITGKLGITSIPTMHVYQNGEIVKTIIGAMPKPKLLRELEPYLG